MLNRGWIRRQWRAGAVLAACLAGAAHAQTSTSAQSGTAADALMVKAATLCYSTVKAGLRGFDCALHLDWREIFVKANPNQAIASDDKRVVLLNGVAIALHARLNGSSTLD